MSAAASSPSSTPISACALSAGGQPAGGLRHTCLRLRGAVSGCRGHLRALERDAQSAVLLALRLVYGFFFAQTGLGKLAHLERTSAFFASLDLPMPAVLAGLVGVTELAGGVLLAAGAGTRAAAAVLSAVMLTALGTAHASEAFASLSTFTEQAPYPFLVATVTLLVFGAGRASVDGVIGAWVQRRSSSAAPGATPAAACSLR